MKKIILVLAIFLSIQFSNANNNRDVILVKARELSTSKNYNEAIKFYVNYIKEFKNEAVNLKSIYFEVANCYFNNNNESMAYKVIKEAIVKYGVTKEEINANTSFSKKFKLLTLLEIDKKYNSLRKKYLDKHCNVDVYIENGITKK